MNKNLNTIDWDDYTIFDVPDYLSHLKKQVEDLEQNFNLADDPLLHEAFRLSERISDIASIAEAIGTATITLQVIDDCFGESDTFDFIKSKTSMVDHSYAFEEEFIKAFPKLYSILIQEYRDLKTQTEAFLIELAECESEFIEHLPDGDCRFKSETFDKNYSENPECTKSNIIEFPLYPNR